ncbi:MAG: hypothetical protein A3J28_03530 [Acidobacteria bacterium RIFCSPLOWO2_12_FULL_60_22]|nr:MAG: hypothetical protein A3J28_03530 [Acidobacteria bacterium RIFCSPLOWO2_12_FULL_60_22]
MPGVRGQKPGAGIKSGPQIAQIFTDFEDKPIPRGACPERDKQILCRVYPERSQKQILRFAQNDKRKAQDDNQ